MGDGGGRGSVATVSQFIYKESKSKKRFFEAGGWDGLGK